MRHSGQAAESYYQRDKTGSGADWFPHEHPSSTSDQSQAAIVSSSPRGGSGRMNVESPAWFSHENPPAPASPRQATSPEVREMKARASGDEIRQILRVDENLQCDRKQQQQQHPEVTSAGGDGGGVDRYSTESLTDRFQQQVTMTTTTTTE